MVFSCIFSQIFKGGHIMIGFFFRVLVFFGLISCAACASRPLSLENALSQFYSGDHGMMEGASGKVRTKFLLKSYQNNTLVEPQVFSYKVLGGRRLHIDIPQGQYYMDFSGNHYGSNFIGKLQCKGGGASSGWSISKLGGEIIVDRTALVLYEWSCGSLGCSYSLVFGNELLLNRCLGSE
jgi:hypothetical protein